MKMILGTMLLEMLLQILIVRPAKEQLDRSCARECANTGNETARYFINNIMKNGTDDFILTVKQLECRPDILILTVKQ